jgi:putative membrane protein
LARSTRVLRRAKGELAFNAIVLVPGAILFWLSANRPAQLPFWAPWDFSWSEYLAASVTLGWFCRGLSRAPQAARPPAWRSIAFVVGIAAIYAVLQTHFDYMAQHMFFLNRVQHVVMHHLGPFLMALGRASEPMRLGMPAWMRAAVDRRIAATMLRVVQQPILAAVLFVGLFAFWLVPGIHFRAMINPHLYALMNWSMVLDGVVFWSLVLDPRSSPPARVGFGARAALAIIVMFPQILLGAVIAFASHDLYPFYDLCGRLFPSVSALSDQRIGAIVSWIPPAMMSVMALLLVLNAFRLHEERAARDQGPDAAALAALARRWTGR